jgi:thymidine phosphorylase
VRESLEVLKGRGPADLIGLSVELTARMLVLAGLADDRPQAEGRVRAAIASGAGLERFRQIIEAQGGDPRVVDEYDRLPAAPARHIVVSPKRGYLARLDAELVGRASHALGAGRDRAEDRIDPSVGIVALATPGDFVSAGDALLELHYRDADRLDVALPLAMRSITVGDTMPMPRPIILGEVH